MNGILLIDKPAGLTSADVVRQVKRQLPRGAKVGHLGTLDPFATGLLPLCLGEGTKIAQFLNTADKRYTGRIRLGVATDTGDRTGTPIREAPVGALEADALDALCRQFTGDLLQRPPMYSALKRDGVPLYRLARQGIEVERELSPVSISALTLSVEDANHLVLDVACSKGTYVRVLAEDLGAALGTVAHLADLRRTRFGDFSITQAVALDAWSPDRQTGLLPLRQAVAHLPEVALDARAAGAARQGKSGVLARLADLSGPAATLVDPAGHLAAVVVREGGQWRYGRVLAPPLHPNDTVVPNAFE